MLKTLENMQVSIKKESPSRDEEDVHIINRVNKCPSLEEDIQDIQKETSPVEENISDDLKHSRSLEDDILDTERKFNTSQIGCTMTNEDADEETLKIKILEDKVSTEVQVQVDKWINIEYLLDPAV